MADSALISRLRADSFSLRAKSRLRRLRFDTRLRAAAPRGEALETQKRGRFRVLFFTYTHISGVPTQ